MRKVLVLAFLFLSFGCKKATEAPAVLDEGSLLAIVQAQSAQEKFIRTSDGQCYSIQADLIGKRWHVNKYWLPCAVVESRRVK